MPKPAPQSRSPFDPARLARERLRIEALLRSSEWTLEPEPRSLRLLNDRAEVRLAFAAGPKGSMRADLLAVPLQMFEAGEVARMAENAAASLEDPVEILQRGGGRTAFHFHRDFPANYDSADLLRWLCAVQSVVKPVVGAPFVDEPAGGFLAKKQELAGLEPEERLARQVSEELLDAISSDYADSAYVAEVVDARRGQVAYGFALGESTVDIEAQPLDAKLCLVAGRVRLGRVIAGYPSSLKWLLCNRAGSPVPVHLDERSDDTSELWLGCVRLTAPSDPLPPGELLGDLEEEVLRIEQALWWWFPQLISGKTLAWLEAEIAAEGPLAAFWKAALSDPAKAMKEYSGMAKANPRVLREMPRVAAWGAEWSSVVKWLALAERAGPLQDEKESETRLWIPLERGRALHRLGRFEESLEVFRRAYPLCEDPARDGALEGIVANLVGLGRHSEVLERLEGAPLEEEPRLLFWRACGLIGAGDRNGSREAMDRYERACGPDVLGRQWLRAVEQAGGKLI
jgi:tetratricopeptide (TPR) repeat protein